MLLFLIPENVLFFEADDKIPVQFLEKFKSLIMKTCTHIFSLQLVSYSPDFLVLQD